MNICNFKRSAQSELARVILSRLDEIEANWLKSVQKDIVRSNTNVSLTALRDGIGDYPREIAKSLNQHSGDLEIRKVQAWTQVAREHAITWFSHS